MIKFNENNPANILFLWIKKKIFSSNYFRNIGLLVGGSSIGQIILLLVSPILTRLYTVNDFGILAIYASVIGILGIAVALKYDLAIIVPKQEKDAIYLVVLALISVFTISGFLGVIFYIFKIPIVNLLGVPNFSDFVWLIPVGLIGSGTYLTLNYWAIRKKSYFVLSRTKIMQGTTSAISQVGIGFLGVGPLGLIIGSILGSSAGIWSLSRLIKKEFDILKNIQMNRLKEIAIRYRSFPLISVPGALLNNAGVHIPVFFLTIIFGPNITGLYALADRVIRSPLSIIGKATQEVYLGEVSEYLRSRPTLLINLFKETSSKLFLISIVPILIAFVISPSAFEFVFGENWRIAGEYVRILSPMLLFRFVVSPLIHTLNLLEKQSMLMVWEGFRLFLVVSVFIYSDLYSLSDTTTMMLYSGVGSISYLSIYFLILIILKKISKKNYYE